MLSCVPFAHCRLRHSRHTEPPTLRRACRLLLRKGLTPALPRLINRPPSHTAGSSLRETVMPIFTAAPRVALPLARMIERLCTTTSRSKMRFHVTALCCADLDACLMSCLTKTSVTVITLGAGMGGMPEHRTGKEVGGTACRSGQARLRSALESENGASVGKTAHVARGTVM